MDVVLVPGFWLGAWAWQAQVAALGKAGHTAHALTLPGLQSQDVDRRGIGLEQHVQAVVDAVDALPPGAVLVGHSGAGAPVHATVDRRPERVARAIYVDSGPLPDGVAVNPALDGDDVEIPLPPWSQFAGELEGLDEQALSTFRERAVPQPSGTARDPQRLSDQRRYGVPVTMICCTGTPAEVQELARQGHRLFTELPLLDSCEYVDLPTSHWPMFSRPVDLAEVLVSAVR